MIPREIQISKDTVFSTRRYSRGIAIVPATAKVAIFDSEGAEVIADTDAVIDADTGEVSYTFPAASNTTLGRNWRIRFTIDGVEKNYLFDIAKIALSHDVSDDDLFVRLSELRSKIFDHSGSTTEDGDSGALIDKNLISSGRNLIGGYISIYISDTAEHNARITAYDAETGTVSFTPEAEDDIAIDTAYSLRGSYADIIDGAFIDVQRDIRRRVKLASGYIDTGAVRELVITRSLYLYSFSQIESDTDKWSIRAREYKSQYDGLILSFGEPYDTNEDGTIDSDEDQNRPVFGTIEVRR